MRPPQSSTSLPPCPCALGLWVRGSQPYSVPASFVLSFFSEGLQNSLPCYTIQGTSSPPWMTNNYPDVFCLRTFPVPTYCFTIRDNSSSCLLCSWGSRNLGESCFPLPALLVSSALFSSVAGTVCYRPLGLPQFHPSFLFWNGKDTQNMLPAISIFCNWNQKSRMRNYRSLIGEARTSFNLENSHPDCDNPPPGAWLESWGMCRKAKQTESVWNCVEYFPSGAVKCPKREQSAVCVHPQQEGEF